MTDGDCPRTFHLRREVLQADVRQNGVVVPDEAQRPCALDVEVPERDVAHAAYLDAGFRNDQSSPVLKNELPTRTRRQASKSIPSLLIMR